MTLEKLNDLNDINKLIQRDEERLRELYAKAGPHGITYSDRPRSTSKRNMIEEVMPEILKIEKRLAINKAKKAEIDEYLDSIEDCHIQLIFRLHFVDKMTWNEVADYIGGGNTDGSVKQMCYRFLKK